MLQMYFIWACYYFAKSNHGVKILNANVMCGVSDMVCFSIAKNFEFSLQYLKNVDKKE